MNADISEHDRSTRFRLDVAYQGSDFAGWSRQPGLRTVQGVLEEAIATSFGGFIGRPALVVAGRTDAGVHAVGQVTHLDLSPDALDRLARQRGGRADPAGALARRTNGVLGTYSDVAVTRASVAPAGFDARFGALWRRYEYRVADLVAGRNPLQRANTAWVPTALDLDAMNDAAAVLLGLHDFGAYCKPREGATTIRTLLDFSWRRDEDRVLRADVRADAFCHSMVRSLVGATVAVGGGRLSIAEVVRLRDGATRDDAYAVMPARGLTFMEVAYPPDDQLAERAALTRARRSLFPQFAQTEDVE
ncbi:tRNA pseudouridine38-40 synthase [Labedella gwakjiensis]|uniref:tRNA pseudouridine synthase A n=1 Tax=Labedella gwakjiensis TaxID=390269 RepID=A0A2P8GRW3_9MICO|nr:tRNA pseudouridine synthase A [Labedella gwakjiensis]PSL36713.1 tRNA pseudouridine38-40 synthase [Labedella gwakjiensis]RUQ84228.1 tRNA pseudouridine(38-40) synthase TruA [Labedella gwakjiensis]